LSETNKVAVGKKILEFDPARAEKEVMLKKITGPSGNLRAPEPAPGCGVGQYFVGGDTKTFASYDQVFMTIEKTRLTTSGSNV